MAVPGGPLRVPASDSDPVDDEVGSMAPCRVSCGFYCSVLLCYCGVFALGPNGPVYSSFLDVFGVQWERFQANGCPDWWLLAKYVGQAAARFPYQPFKGVAGCSSPPGTQISNHADFEDAGMKQRMIHSLDLQQSSSKGPSAAACQQPASASGNDYKAGCSDVAVSSLQSPTAVPDAPSTMPGRSTAGAAAASAACGLKGMFGGCSGACVPPCAAAQADQAS
jgi:hypothetical protein